MTAVTDTIRYVSQRPPRVPPGIYTARLRLANTVVEQPLTVLQDPRVAPADAAAWAEQEQITLQLYLLVNDIHATTNRLRAVAEQAEKLMEQANGNSQAEAIRAAGLALITRIGGWEVHLPQAPLPGGLRDSVSVPSVLLSPQVMRVLMLADQDPPVTAGIVKRTADLEATWAELKAEAAEIGTKELAAFNIALNSAKIPPVVIP
jgi:hypothetical protein